MLSPTSGSDRSAVPSRRTSCSFSVTARGYAMCCREGERPYTYQLQHLRARCKPISTRTTRMRALSTKISSLCTQVRPELAAQRRIRLMLNIPADAARSLPVQQCQARQIAFLAVFPLGIRQEPLFLVL